jgi:hypothetical protein
MSKSHHGLPLEIGTERELEFLDVITRLVIVGIGVAEIEQAEG